MSSIEIVCLIYKSTSYLQFTIDQLEKYSKNIPYRFVANDASDKVLQYLIENKIPHTIYKDPTPNDYYISRVYRAWNHGIYSSSKENVCIINSDMAFSPDWLENLSEYDTSKYIPCSLLIESGKMKSKFPAISYNCGRSPEEYDEDKFLNKAIEIKSSAITPGGLYAPCIFNKKIFKEIGGYSQKKGEPSGDKVLTRKLEKYYGLKHITVHNSVVYHIQEGEMGE